MKPLKFRAFDLDPCPDVECNARRFYADIQPNGECIEGIGNVHEHPQWLSVA